MVAARGRFVLSISRPSFRALLITCSLDGRELDLYAEALPDSPDHDWSIRSQDVQRWTRPPGGRLTRRESQALTAELSGRIEAEDLRVRWD